MNKKFLFLILGIFLIKSIFAEKNEFHELAVNYNSYNKDLTIARAAKLLVEDVDINAKDKNGNTPLVLHIKILIRDVENFETADLDFLNFLIENGARIDIPNKTFLYPCINLILKNSKYHYIEGHTNKLFRILNAILDNKNWKFFIPELSLFLKKFEDPYYFFENDLNNIYFYYLNRKTRIFSLESVMDKEEKKVLSKCKRESRENLDKKLKKAFKDFRSYSYPLSKYDF
ncbi:hypothetical protein GF385_01595 [Candidatus Dependentiae bacterium]|nr:hypothetical protein [Candidatus Dependentiae bacterium]